MRHFFSRIGVILLSAILLTGCGPTISLYDQHSYEQVISAKVEAPHVMDLATDPISDHQEEVDRVLLELEKAKEYEIHRPKNKATAEMWKLILDPNEGSFGGFVKLWQTQSAGHKGLSSTYIANKKEQVSRHFDKIAELESEKIKQ